MTICSGIAGGSIAHRVPDDELLTAGICESCQDKLANTRSWGSASPAPGRNAGKGKPMIVNPKKYSPKRKQPWGMEKD